MKNRQVLQHLPVKKSSCEDKYLRFLILIHYKIMKKIYDLPREECTFFLPRRILRIMKATLFLFFLGVFNLMATGLYPQSSLVSLNMSDTSVKNILKEIVMFVIRSYWSSGKSLRV